MTDIVTPQKRSRIMAAIRGKNTRPEIIIRSGLHKAGFRFRIHDYKLPGRPDIVMRRWKAVIFVNGCFWHCHDCNNFKWPASNSEFWKKKLSRNRQTDQAIIDYLANEGWRICVIWECSLKGKLKYLDADVIEECKEWIKSERKFLQIQHR